MLTRREVLRFFPTGVLLGTACAAETPAFGRIDTHVHIQREAPALAAALRSASWTGLNIVVSNVSGDEPFDLEERLQTAAKIARESRGALPWASAFDARGFESGDFTERTIAKVRKTFEDGALGVKIWKNIGMAIRSKGGAFLLPDDPALLPVYEAIQHAGRTLIAHLAEPNGAWLPLDDKNPEIGYYSKNPQWHMFGRAGAPDKDAILEARDRVLARFPKLHVVGCHLGSDEDNLERLGKRLDAYPNFAVDTAARIRYFTHVDREQARCFLIRYQDRILYATDFSLAGREPAEAARALQSTHDRDWSFFSSDDRMEHSGRSTQGLALPDPVLQKIFRDNAVRWFPGIKA